jgi:hypothetical protein
MSDEIHYHVVNDIRPLMQTTGRVLPGGDCGFCCIAGIFGLPSIASAYEFVESKLPESHKARDSMNAWKMKTFLKTLSLPSEEFLPLFDHYKPGLMPLPWENHNWKIELKKHIQAGCIASTSIRFEALAPPPPSSISRLSDHQVIINGFREHAIPFPSGDGHKINEEFRISCSVRGDYWIEWCNLLYYHGAHPTFIIDPRKVALLKLQEDKNAIQQ